MPYISFTASDGFVELVDWLRRRTVDGTPKGVLLRGVLIAQWSVAQVENGRVIVAIDPGDMPPIGEKWAGVSQKELDELDPPPPKRLTSEEQAAIDAVEPEWKEAFKQFFNEGRLDDGYRQHLDSCEVCQDATDVMLRIQERALGLVAKIISGETPPSKHLHW